MSTYPVTLILGDEVNRPLFESVRRLFEGAGIEVDWRPVEVAPPGEAGWSEEEWETVARAVRQTKLALCCPLGVPRSGTRRSPHVKLREHCECFAGLRPIRSIKGLKGRVENLDLVVVRETTEDVYAGHEHEVMPGGITTLKVVTENASDRIAHFAFSYARRHKRKKVSIIHKANIMKLTDGLFLRVAKRVARAYPDVECEDLIVDNASMQMVLRPERYDVILCGNLYGDILSALAAGLVGGVAAMPGIAVGKHSVIYESLCPKPPELPPNMDNPLKLVLPAIHLLRYLGEDRTAAQLYRAVEAVLVARETVTPDLGGTASTSEMTDALLGELAR
jgi:isocitrate dehydrogenase (NAD+)